MSAFEVLFDHGESSPIEDAAYAPYGALGFPPPPPDRPWIYSNFVQSLDGIASFLGKNASGAHISRSAEDRWLMDLLRAHADAVILGLRTLRDETALGPPARRGPVFRIVDESLLRLRERLGRGPQINIFVTGAAAIDLADYRVFDGNRVQPVILTTRVGAQRLAARGSHPQVRVMVAGEVQFVDLRQAMTLLRKELGVHYLLCEGGPTLYGHLSRAGLIDEKFVTVSPLEIGQLVPADQEPGPLEREHPPKVRPTTFVAPGFLAESAPLWTWVSCRKIGDYQFNRYRRR